MQAGAVFPVPQFYELLKIEAGETAPPSQAWPVNSPWAAKGASSRSFLRSIDALVVRLSCCALGVLVSQPRDSQIDAPVSIMTAGTIIEESVTHIPTSIMSSPVQIPNMVLFRLSGRLSPCSAEPRNRTEANRMPRALQRCLGRYLRR